MSDKQHVLYMPSTPLNLLVSLALASERKHEENASLYFIDQRQFIDQNQYYSCLVSWADSPFQDVQYFTGRETGIAKLTERKNNFRRLKQFINLIQPDVVAVGSDRRIEFQYVMQLLKATGRSAEGWYLDDGLYSYMGRTYHPIKDGINNLIKKVTYGFWWDEPKTVGASKWINKAWLFKPEEAVAPLINKHIQKISADWFSKLEILEFSKLTWSVFAHQNSFPLCDRLLLLPHPNNARKMLDYEKGLRTKIDIWQQDGKRVAVKYHPRVGDSDPWRLGNIDGVSLLPSRFATELLVPLLLNNVEIIGDVGTALLTAQWLRPDLTVIAQLSEKDKFQQSFVPIISKMGVKVQKN